MPSRERIEVSQKEISVYCGKPRGKKGMRQSCVLWGSGEDKNRCVPIVNGFVLKPFYLTTSIVRDDSEEYSLFHY